MGNWVMGKTRRSLVIHCFRRMAMMQIMDTKSDRAKGSQWSKGGSQSLQGTPCPLGAPS